LSPSVTVELRVGGVVARVLPITGYGVVVPQPAECVPNLAARALGLAGTWLYSTDIEGLFANRLK